MSALFPGIMDLQRVQTAFILYLKNKVYMKKLLLRSLLCMSVLVVYAESEETSFLGLSYAQYQVKWRDLGLPEEHMLTEKAFNTKRTEEEDKKNKEDQNRTSSEKKVLETGVIARAAAVEALTEKILPSSALPEKKTEEKKIERTNSASKETTSSKSSPMKEMLSKEQVCTSHKKVIDAVNQSFDEGNCCY